MFSFFAHYLVSLTYMQQKCKAAAFVSAPSRDYGSMHSYELCMGDALWYCVHPLLRIPLNFPVHPNTGNTTNRILPKHSRDECMRKQINKHTSPIKVRLFSFSWGSDEGDIIWTAEATFSRFTWFCLFIVEQSTFHQLSRIISVN